MSRHWYELTSVQQVQQSVCAKRHRGSGRPSSSATVYQHATLNTCSDHKSSVSMRLQVPHLLLERLVSGAPCPHRDSPGCCDTCPCGSWLHVPVYGTEPLPSPIPQLHLATECPFLLPLILPNQVPTDCSHPWM